MQSCKGCWYEKDNDWKVTVNGSVTLAEMVYMICVDCRRAPFRPDNYTPMKTKKESER